jgi:predicted phosphodiesterase
MKLQIHDHHPFKICQLTDIHLGDYPFNDADLKTLASLKVLFDTHSFDLIMITGDLLWGLQSSDPAKRLGKLYDLLNQYPTPVAITYGNHDTEGIFSRTDLREIESHLIHPADKHHSMIIDDRESYALEIYDDQQLAHIAYVWDSGAYSHWQKTDQYAAVEPEQIDWFLKLPYARTSKKMDLGFFHIPFPEYQSAANQLIDGFNHEKVCSPTTNSGLFYALLRQKNVKATFVGHDHDNNFTSSFRGIQLNYGNVTGYNCYGELTRGVREIDVSKDAIKTRIILFSETSDNCSD